MAAKIRGLPTGQFHGDNELPLALGLIYTYVADGAYTTNKATYTTSAADTAHPNPIVLDEEGRAIIWWDGVYDVIIKDAAGNTIDTIPNYGANESSAVSDIGQILNPSFEFGSSTPDDWTLTSDGAQTPATETTDVNHGAQALKFTSVGSGGGTATSVFFECYPTEQILVDFQLKSSVVDVRNLVEVLWFDKAQSSVSNSTVYDESAANPTGWATKFGVVAAPATAVYAKIKIHGCHNSDATAGNSIFDGIRHNTITPPKVRTKGGDIASAATIALTADGDLFDITGSTGPVTAISSAESTIPLGQPITFQFDSNPTFTNHATNLILPGGKDLTVESGGIMTLVEYTADDWMVVNYQRNEFPLSRDHDHGYDSTLAAWVVATVYALGDVVQSTTPDGIFYFECTTAGTSHASTEPVWPTRDGDTIAEATGTVVWTAVDGSGSNIVEESLKAITAGAEYVHAHQFEQEDVVATTAAWQRYANILPILIQRTGTYRFQNQLKSSGAGEIYCNLYRNPSTVYGGIVSFGTQQPTSSTGYVTVTQDIACNAGDLIYIYGFGNGTQFPTVTDFHVTAAVKPFG